MIFVKFTCVRNARTTVFLIPPMKLWQKILRVILCTLGGITLAWVIAWSCGLLSQII